MIDPTLVIRKMNLIAQDLNELQPLARKGLAEYLARKTDEVLAERYLERMIGRMIDINYHLITESSHSPPKDYYESFIQLAQLDVLPAEFARQVAACTGLRNRLVHEYNEMDPARVYEGLQAAVRDIPQYLAHIHQYLRRLPAD